MSLASLDPRYAHMRELPVKEFTEPEPVLQEGFPNYVIVEGLPAVDESKYEKLIGVVKKKFLAVCINPKGKLDPKAIESIEMPYNESGKTYGVAFMAFTHPKYAQLVVKNMHMTDLDKRHKFRVIPMDAFQYYMNEVPDAYEARERPEYTSWGNLRWWLQDQAGRDQFVIRAADKTIVSWNDARNGAEEVHGRPNWTEKFIQWSPHGSFLLTVHRQGVQIWGGSEEFALCGRYAHEQISMVQFSPCEKYIASWTDFGDQTLKIFDVRATELKREFPLVPFVNPAGGPQKTVIREPMCKWSHDDQFFGRLDIDAIKVFDTADFKLLKLDGKAKSIKAAGVRDFAWSPTDNYLAYWTPEDGDKPARLTILSMPSREVVASRNLFQVSTCDLKWTKGGDFLIVNVTRHTKSKKTTTQSFEFFRIRGKGVPVESLDMPDNVLDYAMEPKGVRFCVAHGEPPRVNVSFYTLENKASGKLTKLITLEKKSVNLISWSPLGGNIVLAGLKNLNGQLEFYDAANLQSLATAEHFMCTNVDWDPSGRYVATSVSAWRHSFENGYILWSMQGKRLQDVKTEKFYQLLWRPRPPTLLSKEEIKAVEDNMKAKAKEYDEADAEVRKQRGESAKMARTTMKKEFIAWQDKAAAWISDMRARRRELRNGDGTDDEDELVEVEDFVEEQISVTTTPLEPAKKADK